MRHLAQVNIARQRAPLDDPAMGAFVAALDPVNRVAEHSPGFVWRLSSTESHGATTTAYGEHPVVVNVSVWESYDALHDFVYRSAHGAYLRKKSRWFEPVRQPSTALWWVGVDEHPTVDAALKRLRYLQAHGPSPAAFTLRRRFDAAGRPTTRTPRTSL